ncbi:MAG: hypothetical protein ACLQDV_26135 [Candidatus Binataceae bacterium]
MKKGGEAVALNTSIEADLDLLMAVTVSGGLVRETMTLPKLWLSGLSISVPAEPFASGCAAAGSAATATLDATIPAAKASIATRTHAAA